ncbi:MAG: DeoR family transcriptional regulator [Patescibacteria group bacterium]|nr:DeoR family transcriptional regulator [Patescibacteria group bacterium]
MEILFFIAGISLGFYVKGRFFGAGGSDGKVFAPRSESERKEMQEESREALEERTASRKDRILKFIKKEMDHQKQLQNCNLGVEVVGVTRNEIEELLDVSDQTARKYLNELEDEGKIEQIGESGRGVTYKLK